LIYSGIGFITSGSDIVRRYEAKQAIKNMIISIILVSSSFYLYNLLIDMNSSLTSWVFTQVDPNFFTVTSNNFGNAILQIIMIIPYVLVLLLTVISLAARWLSVSFGIMFIPIGIFMYFVPFLRSYGKLIVNMSLLMIFFPFIASLILLGSSLLANAPIMQNFSIVFYIVAFLMIDGLFFSLIKFVLSKSAVGEAFDAAKMAVAIGTKFI